MSRRRIAMRNLNDYDIIFCDIDDTLIHGYWTELMRITWNLFRNNLISDILMNLQDKFNLYKVNQKLRYMLMNSDKHLVFLTARKRVEATENVLRKILPNREFYIEHLATDRPDKDKYSAILDYMAIEEIDKACVFDDNKDVRCACSTLLELDTFDPVPMFEEKVG